MSPCFRCSRPIPPPSVRPATPVCEMTPTGQTSPTACASRSSSPRSAPPFAAAVRAPASTVTPFIRERSITIPSSQVEKPGMLCPPLRTATGSSSSRANRTASTTSSAPVAYATSAG